MYGPKWPFSLRYGSRDTRRVDISAGLTGCQWTFGFWGVTVKAAEKENKSNF